MGDGASSFSRSRSHSHPPTGAFMTRSRRYPESLLCLAGGALRSTGSCSWLAALPEREEGAAEFNITLESRDPTVNLASFGLESSSLWINAHQFLRNSRVQFVEETHSTRPSSSSSSTSSALVSHSNENIDPAHHSESFTVGESSAHQPKGTDSHASTEVLRAGMRLRSGRTTFGGLRDAPRGSETEFRERKKRDRDQPSMCGASRAPDDTAYPATSAEEEMQRFRPKRRFEPRKQ